MIFMNCRGAERRQWIVKNYNVVPVAHIQVLAGQTKHSDAEATIENDYYIFDATSKLNNAKETIQCGMGAARDFLKLINHKGLPLFNPLHRTTGAGKHARGNQEGHEKTETEWNPVAKQLYNAIMWLIVAWDAKPGTPLFEFSSDIQKYKDYTPYDWKVKRVNTAIINGGKGKTLTEIINDFRTDNNLRDEMCQFDLLTAVINNITDKENPMGLQSYF